MSVELRVNACHSSFTSPCERAIALASEDELKGTSNRNILYQEETAIPRKTEKREHIQNEMLYFEL
jgi:hypothetical protein